MKLCAQAALNCPGVAQFECGGCASVDTTAVVQGAQVVHGCAAVWFQQVESWIMEHGTEWVGESWDELKFIRQV
jgi:hypothetical protein